MIRESQDQSVHLPLARDASLGNNVLQNLNVDVTALDKLLEVIVRRLDGHVCSMNIIIGWLEERILHEIREDPLPSPFMLGDLCKPVHSA